MKNKFALARTMRLVTITLVVTALLARPTSSVQAGGENGGNNGPAAPLIPVYFITPQHRAAKLIYVLAIGADAQTRAKVVALLTRQLQDNQGALLQYQERRLNNSANLIDPAVALVPEPDWGIPEYIAACQSNADLPSEGYSTTDGALIVGLDSVLSYTDERFIWRNNATNITGTLFYSICERNGARPTQRPTTEPSQTPSAKPSPKPSPFTQISRSEIQQQKGGKTTITHFVATPPEPREVPFPVIVWQSNVYQGNGHVWFVNFLNLFGLTATGIAAWAAFTPSVTRATTNTYVFPTPVPGSTPPTGGTITQSQTVNSKTTNAAQLGSIGTGVIGSGLTFENNLSGVQTGDKQIIDALNHIVGQFIDRLECPLNSTPTFRGEPRKLHETGRLCEAVLNATQPFEPPGGDPIPPTSRTGMTPGP